MKTFLYKSLVLSASLILSTTAQEDTQQPILLIPSVAMATIPPSTALPNLTTTEVTTEQPTEEPTVVVTTLQPNLRTESETMLIPSISSTSEEEEEAATEALLKWPGKVRALFANHNAERKKNGVPPFSCLSHQLSALSYKHVQYEISIGQINHDGFGDRCSAAKGARACGENTLYNFKGDPASTTQQWMNSPGHRANILNEKYNHAGFGIETDGNGRWYATAFFIETDRACQ